MRILPLVKAAAEWVEEWPIGPAAWAATFGAIIAVRHLMEIATAGYPVYTPIQFFIHYPLAYLAPLLALTLLLSVFSRERVERVARLMLFAWLLTLLPPVVDLALGRPHGGQIGYLLQNDRGFLSLLVRFFDPTADLIGTTRGIRVETALACLLGGLYVRVKGRGWLRAVACGAAVLPVSLLFFTLPVRFYQACMLLSGPFPLDRLYGPAAPGGGLVSVGGQDVRDMVALAYLAPTTLSLFVLFLMRLGTRDGESLRPLARTAARLGRIRALLPAAGAILGVAAGRVAGALSAPASPAEGIAMVAAVATALLLGAALPTPERRAEPLERWLSLALGGAGVALAASLGATPLALAAVLLAVGTLDLLPPIQLRRWPALGELAVATQGLVGCLLGESLFLGRDLVLRTPPVLAGAVLAAGVLVGVAGRGGDEGVRWFRGIAAGLAPIAFPLLFGELRPVLPLVLIGAGAGLALFAGTGPRLGFLGPLAASSAFLAGGLLTLSVPSVEEMVRRESLRSPQWHAQVGDEAFFRGDLDTAETAYRAALQRDPRYVPALAQLGQVMLQRKDPLAAIEVMRQVLELDPKNSDARSNLGVALLAAGRPGEALTKFDEAIRLDPGSCRALYNKPVALEALKKTAEADVAWRSYLGRCGDDPEEAESAEAVRRRLLSGLTASP